MSATDSTTHTTPGNPDRIADGRDAEFGRSSAAGDQSDLATTGDGPAPDVPPTPGHEQQGAEGTPRPRSKFADVEVGEDGMPDSEVLKEGLKAVIDPEIGYNIVDLGLVYEVEKPEPGHAHVRMTLTAMGCPLTEVIQQQVTMVMLAFPGVESADVEFTFSPPWSPDMIADYVREELRAMGMNV